jgi:hypothetical protein
VVDRKKQKKEKKSGRKPCEQKGGKLNNEEASEDQGQNP